MSRKPLIAGNWKMNNSISKTRDFFDEFLKKPLDQGVDIAICPPFTAILAAAEEIKGHDNVHLGAQNMHWEDKGAYTGEISPVMLREIPCDYVIIGHSERRQYFAETDEMVNKKVKAALKHNLIPIVCVGETLEQREQGITMSWVISQVEKALEGVDEKQLKSIVFAYEPIWAIGTGKTASDDDAQQVISEIRNKIGEFSNAEIAGNVRILYGGSVKPGNIEGLIKKPDIDGALVGGASLDAESFFSIISLSRK